MYVYLAHPIDLANSSRDSIGFYAEQARAMLLHSGATVVYSPALAFTARTPMHSAIQDINMHAIRQADAMLVLYPTDVHTVGVPFELGYAHAIGMPTVIVRGATNDDTLAARDQSAVLRWLNAPLYSFQDINAAARCAVAMARKATGAER